MKEQLNNYKNALKLLSGNSVLFNEVSALKGKYTMRVIRNRIVIVLSVLASLAFMIVVFSLRTLSDLQGVSGVIECAALVSQSILFGVLFFYLLYKRPIKLPIEYLQELNGMLKSSYSCYDNDTYFMMFNDRKCYVVDRVLGVRYEVKQDCLEGTCRLENREWYEFTNDCRIWRRVGFCVVNA